MDAHETSIEREGPEQNAAEDGRAGEESEEDLLLGDLFKEG
jgi:hypothetical protein